MKFAVILAHPRADSLNAQIAHTVVERLVVMGHDVVLRDLYSIGFDPRLMADELPHAAMAPPPPDVTAERRRLADRDGFVFVYPFWFNTPPAILKGYIERVLSMGFGYEPIVGGGTQPLLSGKSLTSFTTSGAPDRWVETSGALDHLKALFDNYLAEVTGLNVITHRHFGGIVPGLTDEAVADILDDTRDTLAKAFSPPALKPT